MSKTVDPDVGSSRTVRGDRRALSKGERQRQTILTTLAELLERRPIGELTVNEISSAAGVQRSGFYFYFESKYAPLAVLAADIWSELMERAESFVRHDGEDVDDFLDRVQEATSQEWRKHSAVLIASIQAIPHDDQLSSMWRTRHEHVATILAAQVLKDRDQGLATPVTDDVPTLVSTLLEMTTHMFYKDRLEKRSRAQSVQSFSALRAIWLASAWGRH
ncbi:TetR/AcrR family transcriptional regulator [Mycolicibacterium neoaurum]|uniref:TetR/AcrR family transcriptional regulator n=1 Tax=Mycolicibacterium neoaurum TaxID=1795 RepID=UPI0026737C91|nr:TetR/AcrR family transcriptional regulator [Mycolicibacterium neoaurum]MDO3401700.1 TetR/AcrR family transcriptional regulator [Mycolicibacterium neoaurum]